MQHILPEVLHKLPSILTNLSGKTLDGALALFDKALNFKPSASTKEEREQRKEVARYLDTTGLEDTQDLASMLVGSGAGATATSYLPLLKNEKGKEALQIAYQVAQLKANLENIDIATEKTRRIVFALKNYVYKEDSGKNQNQGENHLSKVNLKENLSVILILYEHQTKYNVEVNLNLEEVYALCSSDEISQVWTNLIHNALQAMNQKGVLEINCYAMDGMARVEIIDNGPGIPLEIQPRIFDPFFTTKKRGEGTGLGLSICKEIVQKFGGTIEMNSRPQRTCFIVSLPLYTNEMNNDVPTLSEAC